MYIDINVIKIYIYTYYSNHHLSQSIIYSYILLQSCDYLKKISIKLNVATDEGNSRNETWHWTNDEIGLAVQSWLWVRVELMAW